MKTKIGLLSLMSVFIIAGCRPDQAAEQQSAQESRNSEQAALEERNAEQDVYISDFKENEMGNYIDENGNVLDESQIDENASQANTSDMDEAEYEARTNENAKTVTLKGGLLRVGTDIEPGRYVITKNGESAHIDRNENGKTLTSDVLDPQKKAGPASITWTLREGQEIETSTEDDFIFTPVTYTQTPPKTTEYTAGEYLVGADIEHGHYSFKSESVKNGFLIIRYNNSDDFTADQLSETSMEFELKDGDTFEIAGVDAGVVEKTGDSNTNTASNSGSVVEENNNSEPMDNEAIESSERAVEEEIQQYRTPDGGYTQEYFNNETIEQAEARSRVESREFEQGILY